MDVLEPIVAGWAIALPQLLVWSVGAVVAFATWKRHRGVSCLTAAATLVLIVNTLALGVVWVLFVQWFQFEEPDRVARAFSVLNFASSLVLAVGQGLLLAAVFRGRSAD